MALQAYQRIPLILGVPISGNGGSGAFGLSTAARRHAFSFVAWQAKTLNEVRFYTQGTNGSPIAADAQCSLFSDSSAGLPGSSIEARTADAAPVSSTPLNFSGFTTALTAGTRYWLILANLNATPATNNFQVNHAAGQTVAGGTAGHQSSSQGWGWNKMESSDSGSTWAAAVIDSPIMRLKYSDGSYDGTGVQSIGQVANASCVYDKREVGGVFTVPTGISAYVRRCAMLVWKSGTPSGNVRFRIYRGTTLLGTSYEVPVGRVPTSSNILEQAFSSAIQITAGDTIRVVVGTSVTGDTSTNRYNVQEYIVENDANSKLLKPFDGTLSRTEIADNTGTSWTDTDTSYIPFALGLDTAQEFSAVGGGGGAGGGRIFTGM